ncbi:MAG: cytochrome c [Candidatus Marinimicrobia bacterium]|nr:cytochrome c [Candidatus Brocadiales bacterium]MBL7046938.1 cytochrome c [Candidatus Neomarinimicrobiota bacterium]
MKKSNIRILILLSFILVVFITACEDTTETDDPTTQFATDNWNDADIVRGGQLYDKWWKVNGGTEPTSNFDPIWSSQTTNTRSNGDSYRCKECHGWDYVGKDGRYSSGSHYTGFEGVYASRLKDKDVLFDAIKGQGGDHDLSDVLSDIDVLDLTKFVVDGQIDMYQYMDANGTTTGNTTAGQALYVTNCSPCHGSDGNTLDFKSDDGVQGVGWLANDNPQESLHKIRWGHPGSSPDMPSMIDADLTDDETGDILAYSQTLE